MDPHAVNAMGMQGGMSMPMSMSMSGANGANPQAMGMSMNGGMPMNAYGVPQQQQQMMMNMGQMNQMNMSSMAMKMNPNTMNPAAATTGPGMQVQGAQTGATGTDWRIQLTREHRANLIAKIYNEMVRVSADPVPGIKLWMNVSWYELTLYKESRTQEEYINKIFTRLKSLRAQQTDMNAVMAAQTLPNQGMLSRLDFSYYNTLNLNQRSSASGTNGGQVGGYPGHQQFGGTDAHPGQQQSQPSKPMSLGAGGVPANPTAPNGVSTTPRTASKPEGGPPGDMTAEYWRQHAALKAKYHDDVEKVHSAFKKYVDHMKGHDETEQKKKLRYLLSYVQLCASILNEDKTTHAPRKIEELDKVYKYIVKIVNPYLKKLRTETDKRSFTPNAGGVNPSAISNPAASTGVPASMGGASAPATSSSGPNGEMHMQQQQGQPQQNLSLQQKQQQYLMQQRAQQMQQQQQRMQAQARQQQMMQQHHMMMQQQQQQQGPTPPNQTHLSTQQEGQTSMPKQPQNSQPGAQQTPQQKQQLAQQSQHAQQPPNGQQQQPTHAQQPAAQPHQPPPQQQQQQQQQPQQHNQHQQSQQQSQPQQQKTQPPAQQQAPPTAPTSRADTSSLSLDDSLYGGMDSSSLLQMPSNLGSSGSSSGFMNFPNDLSPTHFDLLDMDGFMGQDSSNTNSGPGGSSQNNNSSGGNNTNSGDGGDSDLMFMEAL
ncbi:Hypothetical protein PHPALM_17766 [Phytophthora palmivora]|uniref:Mediator complex subunit 15 KIX domain-containing protein n=1 Tax=Phytophthora palmivora TaxID=4796 RepID=A0A2P4XLL1_9STRA|nr:Hypothetical protein PHPALM_17766 [Phytophthora palmivora]